MSATPPATPPTVVTGVVFDLDGVLVDTEPVHFAATQAMLAPETITIEQVEPFIGTGGMNEWMAEHYSITLDEIKANYSGHFFDELERAPLEPLDGVIELLEAIGGRGLGLAVASQSSRPWVEATLASAGLDQYFALIATAREAGADKPAPDVYLYAVTQLGLQPGECIGVEDSIHGIESASAAGLWVVQSTQASFTPPPQPSADVTVASLRDFDPQWLDGHAGG
ncbi:MAG TPA: HAD family phosphatase [Dehalococcoidia bacterium]|nr:HAD family phosphatase [Dehalococcoidia bacterium]